MDSPQPPPAPELSPEDELTQECRDFLSSLPKEPGSFIPYLYQYQGCWLSPNGLKGVLSFQKHFQARDTDIFLATMPKAGTTWFKAILFSLVNRVHYPDCRQHPLLENNPHALVPSMEVELYADSQDPDLSSFASPRLFATHIPYMLLPTSVKDSACKIVHLCRNPKDTFVSLWHFMNRLKPTIRDTVSIEEAFDEFCKGVTLVGPYWDNVLGYWKESCEKPQKVHFLKYEDVKVQPTTSIRKLAEFLGCPFSSEEESQGVVDDIIKLCSFDNLKSLEVNKRGSVSFGPLGVENSAFFRQGQIGDWTNYLTIEMAEKLDCIIEEKCHSVGLKF